MELANFYRGVKSRGDETLEATPEAVVHAVFVELARRLTHGEAEELAAALPKELRTLLVDARREHVFDADEFIEDVASRLDADDEQAERAVLAVMGGLRQFLDENGPAEQVIEAMPSDLAHLIHAAP